MTFRLKIYELKSYPYIVSCLCCEKKIKRNEARLRIVAGGRWSNRLNIHSGKCLEYFRILINGVGFNGNIQEASIKDN